MTRRLQKNPELEWFKLENYEGLNSFTRYSWAKLIYLKQVCYKCKYLSYDELMMCLTTSPIKNDEFLTTQEKGIKQPIEPIEKAINSIIMNILLKGKAEGISDDVGNTHYSKKHQNDLDKLEYYYSTFMSQIIGDVRSSLLCQDITQTLFFSKKKSITISLDFSDDELIHCFTKLLKELRKEEQEEGKRLSDNKLQKLVTNRVIPCIDLMLWSKFTGNKLTDQQMTDLLYPNGEIYLDSFRQGVKKRAKELLIERKPKFN